MALCVVKRMLESLTLVPGGRGRRSGTPGLLGRLRLSMGHARATGHSRICGSRHGPFPNVGGERGQGQFRAGGQIAGHSRTQPKRPKAGPPKKTITKNYGLDLIAGDIRDNLAAGVVEPAASKIKSMRFATEAAITIRRIDDRITVTKDQ